MRDEAWNSCHILRQINLAVYKLILKLQLRIYCLVDITLDYKKKPENRGADRNSACDPHTYVRLRQAL
jgi:hypothetical protein